jgi:hypothetical protein
LTIPNGVSRRGERKKKKRIQFKKKKRRRKKVRKEGKVEDQNYKGHCPKERKCKQENSGEKRGKLIREERKNETLKNRYGNSQKNRYGHCSHFIICMHFKFSQEAILLNVFATISAPLKKHVLLKEATVEAVQQLLPLSQNISTFILFQKELFFNLHDASPHS